MTTFTVATNEFIGHGKEKAEYHPVVTWDTRYLIVVVDGPPLWRRRVLGCPEAAVDGRPGAGTSGIRLVTSS